MTWQRTKETGVTPTLPEGLAALDRCCERIDAALAGGHEPSGRAARLAEALAQLWPASPLCACLLWEEGRPTAYAVYDAGRAWPEWSDAVGQVLTRPEAREGPLPLPGGGNRPDSILTVRDVNLRGSRWGTLALALRADAPAEPAAGLLLAGAARHLASRLDGEGNAREVQRLQEEAAALAAQSTAGELAGAVAHEVNNFLNTVLLHIAIVEPDVQERLRADLMEIRRQARGVAEVVRSWQQYRRQPAPPALPADLNALVREAAEALVGRRGHDGAAPAVQLGTAAGPDGVSLRLELARPLPPVSGPAHDLRRLCTFLLVNAARAAGGGEVVAQTGQEGGRVVLRVEDTGPTPDPEEAGLLLAAAGPRREGTNALELAACVALARRLGGKIRAQSREQGGLAIIVELPPAQG
jgi:signal transduction histidine kinase